MLYFFGTAGMPSWPNFPVSSWPILEKAPGSGPTQKSDEYHHAMPSSLSSLSIPIGQGSAIFTTPAQSPLGRLWRTAGCGHLRSDAPKHARRRADSIIDCQNCVTCIAPNKRALAWQSPKPAAYGDFNKPPIKK
ncbi:uncharacterized protein TrAtP1_004968 [Trichoderma atroviride]|uniref:uncharacterized protein n=1 Tax=Hypocrea atroviridis TaxID=63577 RepID=UPI003319E02D|nr:hypothetical protein TrAtP1_004968 [Trichoderma atroviride]